MSSRTTRTKPPINSVVQRKESRGKKILEILRKDEEILAELSIPKHESTKGLQPDEIRKRLENKQCLLNVSLPKNGSLNINVELEGFGITFDKNKGPKKSEANTVTNFDRENYSVGDSNYDPLKNNIAYIDQDCLQNKDVSTVWLLGAGEESVEKGNGHDLSPELAKAIITDGDIRGNGLLMDEDGNLAPASCKFPNSSYDNFTPDADAVYEDQPLQNVKNRTPTLKRQSGNHQPSRNRSKIIKYNFSSDEGSTSDPDWVNNSSSTDSSNALEEIPINIEKKNKVGSINNDDDFSLGDMRNKTGSTTQIHEEPENSTTQTSIIAASNRSYFENKKNILIQKPSKIGEKRIYDKKQACLFCKKVYCKLTQHFEGMHKDKKQVQDYLSLSKNSRERSDAIRRLRNKGNFIHNAAVLEHKAGSLLVCRRSGKDLDYTSYLPCEFCLGYFYKKKLYRHVGQCPDKPTEKTSSRTKVQKNALLLTPPDKNSTDLFRGILANMKNDAKSAVVRGDPLLVLFGSKEATKKKDLPHTRNHTSYKVRLFAELLIHLNEKKTGISTATQCVMPENFEVVARSVMEISRDLGKPSNGLKLGHNLKKCARILRSQSIISGNEIMRNKAENFLTLYTDEWEDRISQPLHAVLYKRKFNTEITLPTTEDIMKLHKFIADKEEEYIRNNFVGVKYVEVAYITLCHIIAFNRRRVGEVSLMEVDSYRKRVKATKPQGDVEAMLSKAEKKLYSDFEIVHVRGKKGARVDCLLTQNMTKCMDFLVNTRSNNGVLDSNIYVFCLPFSEFCMRGCDAIKFVANNSGANFPTELKSTKLRKHISTVSQLLNLSENEINSLCKHMGHNPRVHMEYYQMPEPYIQKTKIGKILLALEQGEIRRHKGKKLTDFEMAMQEDQHKTVIERREGDINITNDKDSTSESSDDSEPLNQETQIKKSPKILPKERPKKTKRKTPTIRERWSPDELSRLKHFFQEEIILAEGPPTKSKCESFLCKYPEFKIRGNYLKIKWRVNAMIQQVKKQKKV